MTLVNIVVVIEIPTLAEILTVDVGNVVLKNIILTTSVHSYKYYKIGNSIGVECHICKWM